MKRLIMSELVTSMESQPDLSPALGMCFQAPAPLQPGVYLC